MEKAKKFLKRYKIFLILAALNLVIGLVSPEIGKESLRLTKSNVLEMLSIIPPIFVLLGLLDVWVKRETMVKYMGKGVRNCGFIHSVLLSALLLQDRCMQPSRLQAYCSERAAA